MTFPQVRIGLDEAEAVASTFTSLESFRACCTSPSSRCSLVHLNRRFRELGIPKSAELQLKQAEKPGEHVEKFFAQARGRVSRALRGYCGLEAEPWTPRRRNPPVEVDEPRTSRGLDAFGPR